MICSITLSCGWIIAVAALTLLNYAPVEAQSYRHLHVSILGIHDINRKVLNLGNGEHGVGANGANGGTTNGQPGSNSLGLNGTNSIGKNGNNTNGANG